MNPVASVALWATRQVGAGAFKAYQNMTDENDEMKRIMAIKKMQDEREAEEEARRRKKTTAEMLASLQ